MPHKDLADPESRKYKGETVKIKIDSSEGETRVGQKTESVRGKIFMKGDPSQERGDIKEEDLKVAPDRARSVTGSIPPPPRYKPEEAIPLMSAPLRPGVIPPPPSRTGSPSRNGEPPSIGPIPPVPTRSDTTLRELDDDEALWG